MDRKLKMAGIVREPNQSVVAILGQVSSESPGWDISQVTVRPI
jgi:hypothetical protein